VTVLVRAIDHVQLLMPAGAEAEAAARAFYADVLGLVEAPKPRELAGRGGLWFRSADAAIHLGVDPAFQPARRSHPALVVDSSDSARATLQAAGRRVIEDDTGLPVRRFYVEDPFGNRLELVDAADAGFTDPARRG